MNRSSPRRCTDVVKPRRRLARRRHRSRALPSSGLLTPREMVGVTPPRYTCDRVGDRTSNHDPEGDNAGEKGTVLHISGGDGDRTHYLLHAMQALYQLSYAPKGNATLSAGLSSSALLPLTRIWQPT